MGLEILLGRLAPGGRDFERLCKWVLENVPEYRQRLRRVWLWDEWPGRWGRDTGIDLVAEDREGGLWAVQAKHYNPAYAIKKADLDSFLSESSRPGFTYRLVIATTDHIGPTARKTLDAQEKPVGTLLRSQLEMVDVEWPVSIAEPEPAERERKSPRPHQLQAIAACADGFATADRGQLVMACGTGKTLVGPFLAQRMSASLVLVLVPSLSLLGQTLREWATAIDFDYLAVCSDETVTKDERDAVVASTSELGLPVTTDAEQIAHFLRAAKGSTTRVVFSTYQSSPQIAAAQASVAPSFDLVIADEAHRCAGPEAGVFASVVDANKIRARKRLFMTATPRFFTGRVKREAKEADWEVASMDEEAKFGKVLHRLAFAHAIEQDLLSDYQVVVVGVGDDEARELAARGAFVSRDGQGVTDARTLAREIGLLRAMAKYNLRRVVTFHSRINNASAFAASLPTTKSWLPEERRPTGTLWTGHASGKMTAGERDARLKRLRDIGHDERGVLTNARCLNEGVDVPELDAITFVDPRRSQVDVVQAVGRAIRKAKDKKIGTIVIPIVVTDEGDAEHALASSEFSHVWQVVRALRDHDEVLAEEIDELRRELGKRGSVSRRPRKIVLDVPVGIGEEFVRAFDARLVESTSAKWQVGFGNLQTFVAREGHARVPRAHREQGHSLGWWVGLQRKRFELGLITAERIALLEAVTGWVWSEQDSRWEEGFSHLERFVAREGHPNVPQRHTEGGFPLGKWLSTHRSAYVGSAAGVSSRPRKLSPERIARFEALPNWTWRLQDTRWEVGFTHLQRFVAKEGHARPKSSHREASYPLGHWVGVQRKKYNSGVLRPERAERLEGLPGWTWGVRQDSVRRRSWAEHLAVLERFVARTGHARVPGEHLEEGRYLGKWVTEQRTRYRHNRLPPDQAARLQGLPGWRWGRGKKADDA